MKTSKYVVYCVAVFFILVGIFSPTAYSAETTLKSEGYYVQETKDNGYIITGKISNAVWGQEISNIWLIKTDKEGNKEWDKTFGDEYNDIGYEVQQTNDNGFILTGFTSSKETNSDVILIKTDENGNEEWQKVFGGKTIDMGLSVRQTKDNGFIISGQTTSYGSGTYNLWLIKTDENGEKQWDKTFSIGDEGSGSSVQQTSDNGFIIAGETNREGYDEGPNGWLIKTDENGSELWNKTYDTGYDHSKFVSVQQTDEGGYILTGHLIPSKTQTAGELVFYEHLLPCVWLVKTDQNGNEIWNKTFDSISYSYGAAVDQTSDKGFIIVGHGINPGEYSDILLIKTDGNGNKEWETTFGDEYFDEGLCVQETTDGSYIISGSSSVSEHTSFGQFSNNLTLMKVDENGNEIWTKTFDGNDVDVQMPNDLTSAPGGWIILILVASFVLVLSATLIFIFFRRKKE